MRRIVEVLSRRNLFGICDELIKRGKFNVLATGITTAHEVRDNQLREFIITNFIKKRLVEKGYDSKLLLINDTYDPLTELHFKRLLKFDPDMAGFKKYLGTPICKIPAPYLNFSSYSDFFESMLIDKLNKKKIFRSKYKKIP